MQSQQSSHQKIFLFSQMIKYDKIFIGIFYAFALLAILYFSVSIVNGSFFTDELTSETLDEISYDKSIAIDGIALRNETMLYSNEPYYSIRYLAKNGSRVAKSSSYAAYLTSQPDEENREKLLYLYRKINQLEDTIRRITQYDIITIDEKIKDEIQGYLELSHNSTFDDRLEKIDNIQISMNQKMISTEGSTYFEYTLNELRTEQQSVISQSSANEKHLYTNSAGYFTSLYDGYEYLNYKDYVDITVADYSQLISQKAMDLPELYVGKIQNEPIWKYYSLISTDDATTLYVGKTVYLEFDSKQNEKFKVRTQVEYISKPVDGNVAVTFSCNILNNNIFDVRKDSCRMIMETYTGFKVSSEALRVNNGETGVYVLSGQRVIFKPVEILYSTEDFSVITSKNKTGNKILKAKDEVVIGGHDLFDGKILNLS